MKNIAFYWYLPPMALIVVGIIIMDSSVAEIKALIEDLKRSKIASKICNVNY